MFSVLSSIPLHTYAKIAATILLIGVYTFLVFKVEYYHRRAEKEHRRNMQLESEIKALKFEKENAASAAEAEHEIDNNNTPAVKSGVYRL